MDHSTPTHDPSLPIADPIAAAQIRQMEKNAAEFGVSLYGLDSPKRGIVHVIGPELGLTQPGMTIVCGDSHTATHGAFGTLAFGIGTSEVEHVLATQCLLQRVPKTYEVRVDGKLAKGVSAKDIILAVIAKIGTGGGQGYVLEYRGEAIKSLSMDARTRAKSLLSPCRSGSTSSGAAVDSIGARLSASRTATWCPSTCSGRSPRATLNQINSASTGSATNRGSSMFLAMVMASASRASRRSPT